MFLHRLTYIEDRLAARTQAENTRPELPLGHPARSRPLRAAATLNDQFYSLNRRREKVLGAYSLAQNELAKLNLAPNSRPTAPVQPEQTIARQPSLASVFRIASPAPDFEAESPDLLRKNATAARMSSNAAGNRAPGARW